MPGLASKKKTETLIDLGRVIFALGNNCLAILYVGLSTGRTTERSRGATPQQRTDSDSAGGCKAGDLHLMKRPKAS